MPNTDLIAAANISEPTGWQVADLSSADAIAPAGQRGIWVGSAGDIKIDDLRGNLGVVIPNVPIGLWPIPCKKIWKTGTTAASIVFAFG